jgi:hypothetical protein
MNDEDKISLREFSRQLALNQSVLDELSVRRTVINQQRIEIENNIKTIIEKPEYSQINQLALSDGKTIRIIRQHSKGWSLPKGKFKNLIYEFWNSTQEKNPENLIDFVYRIINIDSQSNELKLELR